MVCVGFHEATSWPCGPRPGAPGFKKGGERWVVRTFFTHFSGGKVLDMIFLGIFFKNPVDYNKMYMTTI